MNPKIFVGVAVAVIGIVIALFVTSGSTIVNELSQKGLSPQNETPLTIEPLKVTLSDISIEDIEDTDATISVKLQVTNPNTRTALLHSLKFQLYANDLKIATSEVGEQGEGFIIGSNYFTLLPGQPTSLSDKITIKNSGNFPELWSAFEKNDVSWHISGDAFYSMSSMTSGGEQHTKFELQK